MRLKTMVRLFLLFISLLLVASGCQQASDEIVPIPTDKVVTPNSKVAGLIERVALNDGSTDNILDNSSCSLLVLPVTVLVNGQQIQLNSNDDFKQVERIWDEAQGDDDTLAIVFPVTVILADHSKVVLDSNQDLEAIMDRCATEGGMDDDIECVDFKYPLTVSVYNSKIQLSDIVVISQDIQLFDLFEKLDSSELVGIQFPIVVVLSDGSEIAINSNTQLESAIENAIDDCDEDDDNDFDDDDVDVSGLASVMVNGSWKVDYYFDESIKTAEFAPYLFSFTTGDAAMATDGTLNVPGMWRLYGDSGVLELVLNFGEDVPFKEIEEDWVVVSYSGTTIVLSDKTNASNAKSLTFKKQ